MLSVPLDVVLDEELLLVVLALEVVVDVDVEVASAPGPLPASTAPAWDYPPVPAGPPGRGAIAASHGRAFGAAVQSQRFREDPSYGPMVDLECTLLIRGSTAGRLRQPCDERQPPSLSEDRSAATPV